ncbi:MAG: radical SAM protein [Lachnospiraceae bacterium]|nr:radical SAM protein [Lachnospiraceae bacterium]
MIKKRIDDNFVSVFNTENGMYLRSGIIKDGIDTGIDPFKASFPELLDVGIMGHCSNKIICKNAGIECYQGGSERNRENMSVDNFKKIINQCSGKTYQIALGGNGDPDEHESIEEILELCRFNDIVPNYTTSGMGIDSKKAKMCSKYCGAVAVSWQKGTHTINAIKTLLDQGVKTNIHYVINNSNIDELLFLINDGTFEMGVNAIVFLLHKPVGLGSMDKVLKYDDPRLLEFLKTVSGNLPYKVGFDSCFVPAIINILGDEVIDIDSIDTCEAARWSAYISADMQMMPCSFDNIGMRWGMDLNKYTIKEVWESEIFESFRGHFVNSCKNCSDRKICMGGCPICREIVLCNRSKLRS